MRNLTATAILFQAGYLTIKDYDADADDYTLGVPDEEVRQARLGRWPLLRPRVAPPRRPRGLPSVLTQSVCGGQTAEARTNAQVLMRFVLIQSLLIPFLFALFTKVR